MNAKPPTRTDGTIVGAGISRRSMLKKVLVALTTLPALKLVETVARAERRRQHHKGKADDIWIGHC